MGLRAFIKGTGGKGLHMLIPLNSPVTFKHVRDFVKTRVAERMAKEFDLTTSYAQGAKKGRILMDWRQNSTAMTMIAPYSLRAREHPYVSAPLLWEEVQKASDTDDETHIRYDIFQIKERIGAIGDPIAPVQTMIQELPR
jgi:bifunctional non-homologous end joining protein LigD